MAKRIMEQGALIDKSRDAIVQAIAASRRQEKLLKKQGVQIGSIHYKADRKSPTMFVYEPVKEGKRRYVSVGTDPKKQTEMQARVNRWKQRDLLQKEIERLEKDLKRLDWEIQHLVTNARKLEVEANEVRKKNTT